MSAPSPTTAERSAPARATRARWCRATRALTGATVTWLVFVVMHGLFNDVWWLWALPDLAPPIGYALVPVLLLAALPLVRIAGRPLPRAPRRGIAAGALVALGVSLPHTGMNPYVLGHSTSAPPADAVRVFVWNSEYWDQDDDPDRFLSFLVDQRADIYLLQEYLNWDRDAGLGGARPVDDMSRLRRAFPGFAIAARGELITLSRFAIVARPAVGPDRAVRANPNATFADIFDSAKVLRTDLLIGGTRLSAYNVHLPVTVHLTPTVSALTIARERAAAWRTQQRGLSADIAANANPVLVAGDFNASPASAALDGLRGRLADAADVSGAPYPATWPAGKGPAWWRLDWAFTSPSVRVHRYALRDPDGLSDHRAQQLVISTGKSS